MISAPASSLRPDFSTQVPSTRSRSRVFAFCSVKPFLPRALGLFHAGVRETSKCRPLAENSQVTRGSAPASAWSLRSRLPSCRAPGTEP